VRCAYCYEVSGQWIVLLVETLLDQISGNGSSMGKAKEVDLLTAHYISVSADLVTCLLTLSYEVGPPSSSFAISYLDTLNVRAS
jgi:hypothetical protein